jgi:hypothetical protein
MTSIPNFSWFSGLCALLLVGAGVSGDWWPRLQRTVARIYADPRQPYMLRVSVALGRVVGLLSAGITVLGLLPKDLARVASIPLMLAFSATMVVVYRAPLSLMPSWLRADVLADRVSRPRCTTADAFLLALLAVGFLAGAAAAAWLLFVDAGRAIT